MSCIYKYKGKNYTKDEFYSLVRTTMVQPRTVQKYEKVLFPTGSTASKVEGHTTLEEFKKEKEDRIKELENNLYYVNVSTATKVNRTGFKTKEDAEKFAKENNSIAEKNTQDEYEINQLKKELERVETEGFGALKPIYNFYENQVKNILKKISDVKTIKDEHGNTWNEISLNNSFLNDIDLSLPENFNTELTDAETNLLISSLITKEKNCN